ncbi:hypothetical protein GMST_05320 [Geomonas silvestris]|uniref:DUF5666 domain-containing protein n=1 Tax=Geomonas silvestris TaxID=2740184 RepID=A0A6V8ME22_9BACT|nr:DUF5666 domain-containing protein [Geomonas silvestris]GFO58207.1 hypothetical protein GMST_05320 [Geomonas silvestris]
MNTLVRLSLLLSSVLLVSACGGGSGSSAPAQGVSKGVITALGSVIVNGIEYNIDNAAIKIDDNPGTPSQLKVGMVVKVRGSADNSTRLGVAREVEAHDVLEGNISALGANTITVMGQTVHIEDNVTRLNDDNTVKVFSAANFQIGDRVEVHGFPDDQGGLRATRVAKITSSNDFEIKGYVLALGSGSFGLSLTPGGAAILTVTGSLPAGAGIGSLVEVRSNAAPVAGALTATLVKLEDRLAGAGEKVEVEGIVTSGSVDDFVINGQEVLTSSSTIFEGGLKTDFAVGVQLEAEGTLNGSGALVTSKISFRSNIKIEADLSALSSTSFSVVGKTVTINAFTRIDGGPLANGQHVEVRAIADRDGNLVARRIVVKGASSQTFIQGPVSAKDAAAGTLSILGLSVLTTSGTEFRISTDSAEQAVGQSAFFAQVTLGVTIVKARWNSSNTLAAAQQVEIELGK